MTERPAPNYIEPKYRSPTGEEFRQLLKAWDLTGAAAGLQAGVNGRQIRRYTAGEQSIPYAVLFTLAMKNEGIQVSASTWRAELHGPLTRRVDSHDATPSGLEQAQR